MTPRAWLLAGASLALAACGGSTPAGMPDGYTRVNDAFGVRMDGLVDVQGEQRAPVVEFRANGDYAMYPIITDCEGNLRREAGLVFAADGTVREQVTEQPVETVKASPHFGPVVDAICAPSRKALAAIKDDASNRRTRHGLLRIQGERGEQTIMLKQREVAKGDWLRFVGGYRVGDDDLVLVHEQGTGTACPGGQFGIIAVSKGDARVSQPFGTCVEGPEPSAVVVAGALEVTVPGENGTERFRYTSGVVEYIAPEPAPDVDAEFAADDASLAPEDAQMEAPAADARVEAAPVVARAPRAEDRSNTKGAAQSTWTEGCVAISRRVVTPAGSIVALNPTEARRYCDCVWQRAPDDAGQAVRGGALEASVSELLPQAHAACIRAMI